MSADSLAALARLMAELQALYPSQALPEGTPDLWLARWEEIAAVHGLKEFANALWALTRERGRRFLPQPDEIDNFLHVRWHEETERKKAERYLSQLANWKAIWEWERSDG